MWVQWHWKQQLMAQHSRILFLVHITVLSGVWVQHDTFLPGTQSETQASSVFRLCHLQSSLSESCLVAWGRPRKGINRRLMGQSLLFTSHWLKPSPMAAPGCRGTWVMWSSYVPGRGGEWILVDSSNLCPHRWHPGQTSKWLIWWFLCYKGK